MVPSYRLKRCSRFPGRLLDMERSLYHYDSARYFHLLEVCNMYTLSIYHRWKVVSLPILVLVCAVGIPVYIFFALQSGALDGCHLRGSFSLKVVSLGIL